MRILINNNTKICIKQSLLIEMIERHCNIETIIHNAHLKDV